MRAVSQIWRWRKVRQIWLLWRRVWESPIQITQGQCHLFRNFTIVVGRDPRVSFNPYYWVRRKPDQSELPGGEKRNDTTVRAGGLRSWVSWACSGFRSEGKASSEKRNWITIKIKMGHFTTSPFFAVSLIHINSYPYLKKRDKSTGAGLFIPPSYPYSISRLSTFDE